MDSIVWTVIGGVAASLTTFGFVPQILRMRRTKSVGDVSVVTFYQFTAGVTLWAIYGASRGDPIVLAANVVALATLVVALTLYYRYKVGSLQRLMLLTLRTAQEIGADTTLAVRRSSHGLIRGVVAAGGDVAAIAKGTVQGAIVAAQSARLEIQNVASAAAAGAVAAAIESSSSVGLQPEEAARAAAVSVVEAAIAHAESAGLSPKKVASATGAGAAEAAAEVSMEAERVVREAVSDILAGLEVEEEKS